MSCLVVGLSHATAPFELVERVSLDRDGVLKMLTGATDSEYASEAIVLATCNRVEVYTQVDRFHGSVEAVSRLMAERTGLPLSAVAPHLYVHYDDGAVDHLFRVSSGLDSVAVGEAQILGQVRDALRVAQEHGTVGPALNLLFQQALRVAKRVHAETDIDRAAPSLVAAALDRSAELFGTLSDRRVVVVGAGSMGALVLATAHARGVRSFGVANRTPERAQRLADQYAADCGSLDQLVELIDGADVVVTCAGAPGLLIDATLLESCERPPRVLIDLAMPHDIDPAVGDLGEITLIDLPAIAEGLRTAEAAFDLDAVREILADEVASFVAARRQASVTPTVVALRSMATDVVDAEVARLLARLPELTAEQRQEVRHAVRRVADKLVHRPSVRVRELAAEPGQVTYAAALAELFALDPEAVDAVTRPETR